MPLSPQIEGKLHEFAKTNRFLGKGALSLALVVTRRAAEQGLPLDPEDLLTAAKGQVAGLGKAAVQAILKEYGIERVLAEEAGRTNRGNIGKMSTYVELLNALHRKGSADLPALERWWIERVEKYFSARPFKFRLDPSKSVRAAVGDLLEQALQRQRELPGATYVGTVLQHLVGAKLEGLFPNAAIEHHGASVADAQAERDGDFSIGDAAIHVTSAPTEALIRKCMTNLEAELRPIIVTTADGVQGAYALSRSMGLEDRIEVFEIGQFISTNVYERSGFAQSERRQQVRELVDRYNDIVDAHETDPSLRIEIAR